MTKSAVIYTDGSYNDTIKTYGSGYVMLIDGDVITNSFSGSDPEYIASANIAGELEAVMQAIRTCMDLGVTDIKIMHDYMGVQDFVTGKNKAGTPITKKYQVFMGLLPRCINLSFEHVKAHTGITYNEMADKLAKEACGI